MRYLAAIALVAAGCQQSTDTDTDTDTEDEEYLRCHFEAPPTLAVPAAALSNIATADFDEDGHDDVAVVSATTSTVDVYRTLAAGSFELMTSIPAVYPSIVAGDLDDDGHADLALAPNAESKVDVLFGGGDGTFGAPTTVTFTGRVRFDLFTADINGDEALDLVVGTSDLMGPSTGPWSDELTILLNGGQRTFTPTTVAVGLWHDFAVGDFDGNGTDDLVLVETTTGPHQLCMHPTTNEGTFGQPSCVPALGSPTDLLVADFTGDGHVDVAGTDDSSPFVSFYRGHGDGTVEEGVMITSPFRADSAVSADVDDDGSLDLVIHTSTGSIATLFNDGAGGFSRQRSTASVSQRAYGLAITEVTHDGIRDVVIAGWGTGIGVVPGMPDGHLGGIESHKIDFKGADHAVGDLDEDGRLDVVVGGFMATAVHVFFGQADGSFLDMPLPFRGEYPTIADFDRDGHDDILLDVTMLLNHGDGTFEAIESGLPFAWYDRDVADIDDDGDLDIVVTGGSGAHVALGKGDGTFGPTVAVYDVADFVSGFSLGDVDGDGDDDLLVGGASLLLFHGNGDGTFASALTLNAPGYETALADFNGDMTLEIVAFAAGQITILSGESDGSFVTLAEHVIPGTSFALADMGGDALPDLVIANPGTPNDPAYYVHILHLGPGGVADGPARSIAVPGRPMRVLGADIDGSGHNGVVLVSDNLEYLEFERSGHFAAIPQQCAVAD